MINKVYTMLKSCNVPLGYIDRPPLTTSNIVLSYHFFNQRGGMFGDGKVVEKSGSLQIDIFSKNKIDFTVIKAQIEQLLEVNGFLSPNSYDTQEDIEGVGLTSHVVITSNYLESEVLNNG